MKAYNLVLSRFFKASICGPSLAAVSLYLESAKSVLLANLVSSRYRNGKDLGHHRCETTWSPVALCITVRASLVASSPCPCAEIAYNMKP